VAIALEEFELGARASCNITKKKRRAGRNARLQGWSKVCGACHTQSKQPPWESPIEIGHWHLSARVNLGTGTVAHPTASHRPDLILKLY
jgi:hypothetical protein